MIAENEIHAVAQPQPSFPQHQEKNFLSMGAWGVSLLLHLAFLALIGGVVIVSTVIPKQSFTQYMPIGETLDQGVPLEITDDLGDPGNALPDMPSLEAPSISEPDAGFAPDVVMTESVSSAQTFIMPTPNPNSLAGTKLGLGSGGTGTSSRGGGNGGDSPRGPVGQINPFGSKGSASDAMIGHLYDFKQGPDRSTNDMSQTEAEGPGMKIMDPSNGLYDQALRKFAGSWNPRHLETFYRSTQSLSAYQIFIPRIDARAAPEAFGLAQEVKPKRWAVLYRVNIEPPVSAKYRFVGCADDVLAVKIGNKTVLDAGLTAVNVESNQSKDRDEVVGKILGWPMRAGNWINMSVGTTYPMEILIGERPGGKFFATLLVQRSDETYEKVSGEDTPILPVFQLGTVELPKYTPGSDGPHVRKESIVFKGSAPTAP
ncbi:MAG: hypothetical protein HC904_09760 [Blastochloris sp.]|nr:hypothetical protein [Blastochloris sp.]